MSMSFQKLSSKWFTLLELFIVLIILFLLYIIILKPNLDRITERTQEWLVRTFCQEDESLSGEEIQMLCQKYLSGEKEYHNKILEHINSSKTKVKE